MDKWMAWGQRVGWKRGREWLSITHMVNYIKATELLWTGATSFKDQCSTSIISQTDLSLQDPIDTHFSDSMDTKAADKFWTYFQISASWSNDSTNAWVKHWSKYSSASLITIRLLEPDSIVKSYIVAMKDNINVTQYLMSNKELSLHKQEWANTANE